VLNMNVKRIFVDMDGDLTEHSKLGLLVLVLCISACGIIGAVAGCFRGWFSAASFLGSVFSWCWLGLVFGSLVGILAGIVFTLISHNDRPQR